MPVRIEPVTVEARPAMLRFLPGLLLVQLVVLALYLTNAGATMEALALRVLLPALVVTLVTALWFGNLSRIAGERRHAELVERHAREREQLKVEAVLERERVKGDAARERERTFERLHRESRKAERRVDRMANLKVGLAGLSAVGVGVLFLLTELLTLGLLTITTSAGALGGYLLRWRQTRERARLIGPGPAVEPADAVADAAGARDGTATGPASAPRLVGSGKTLAPRPGRDLAG